METIESPMGAPITATFRMSLAELLQASQLSLRYSPVGRKYRNGFLVVGPLGIVFGTAILIIHGLRMIYIGLPFVLLGLALSLSPFLGRRELRKHYSKRPDRDMKVTWEFYPDRIVTATEATSSKFEWRMFPRVIQTSGGFLFYVNDRMFHWIPTYAFTSPEHGERLCRLLQTSVPDF